MDNNPIWDFIEEQPEILQGILKCYGREKIFIKGVKKPKKIIITASGTSLNAAYTLKPFFNQIKDCQLIVENPFQLRHYHTLLDEHQADTVIIGISQTGKSTGTMDCIKKANAHQIPTIALTEALDSPLAKLANHVVKMGCGPEDVPPKTKGYSATVLTLQLLVLTLLDCEDQPLIAEYEKCVNDISEVITASKLWSENNSHWSKAPTLTVVGFGYNDGVAKEGALKLLETLQIPVMNYDLEEFMHGPHRTIVEDSFIILIQTKGVGEVFMNNLIEFVKSKTTNYLVISSTNASDAHTIQVKHYPLSDAWMQTVIPLQVLCSYLPEVNGINPAAPVYGSFATTVGTRVE